MPISETFTSTYSQNWHLNFSMCAPNGYLKYTDLCNIFQLTAASHSELGGISFSDMQVHDQAWVLTKMRLEIEALPKWKEEVKVTTWIISLEKSRSVRAIELYHNGIKLASAETYWVVLNTKIRRPEALVLPDAHFEKYNDRFATIEKVKRIAIPENATEIHQRKVKLSDLDIVNHVNNVKYLEWCLDELPAELVLNQKIKSLDMNFIKELVLDDAICISKTENESSTTCTITKEEQVCFVLEIQ